ncbi:Flp family type IVb pilin [Acidocella sp.]|jgi:Flp pilus assembly pilin Flp|uniref:Flp family type IVb pilin n=1 Tax=Acidocella sp. TaxID=50710 RepID=UPI00260229CE|nr:Flp family type IVb pilin [Acidocella sp.]
MLISYLLTRLPMLAHMLRADRRAVTAIEYAIIAAVMAVAVFGGAKTIGPSLSVTFNQVASEL